MKKISLLGSTGSIGTQTIEVVRNLENVQVVGLTANRNITLLKEQILTCRPTKVAVMDEAAAEQLRQDCKGIDVRIVSGMAGVLDVAVMDEADTAVNALVGNIGLLPTVHAIKAGKHIALANKECLVCAGEIIMKLANAHNVNLYPIDSEHSAIFQCLSAQKCGNNIEKIYLTASGGPFRGKIRRELENVTAADALAHPNWTMGSKISVDSATLMNKGLEVIEAHWLFGVPLADISVLVHPQSVIHSMVEFEDGSVLAQLGEADMRLPIQYALTYPNRTKNSFKRIDFLKQNQLTFEPPDLINFPCLQLAYDAMAAGGLMPAVLNGANETAVALFLDKKIPFLQIPVLIEKTMCAYTVQQYAHNPSRDMTLQDVLDAEVWAKAFVLDHIKHTKDEAERK